MSTAVKDATACSRHDIENLARALARLGERHAADHDVLHLSRTLALKLDQAAETLAAHAPDLHTDELGAPRGGGPAAAPYEQVHTVLGPQPSAGARLLVDLRGSLAACADTDVGLTILIQGAHATKDPDLLATATGAQHTVRRVHRWALTRLKSTAPQVLAAR